MNESCDYSTCTWSHFTVTSSFLFGLVIIIYMYKDFSVYLVVDGNVRLVGGWDINSGRVEVFYNNEWGTVCDDNWDVQDATVICRQLNLPIDFVAAHSNSYFGEGSGPIWLDDVGCSGQEQSLNECPNSGWGSHNCGHSEDAGVSCTNGML